MAAERRGGNQSPCLVVEALVASWTDGRIRDREAFVGRLTDVGASLPLGLVLQMALRSTGEDRLSLKLAIQGDDRAMIELDRLGEMLAGIDSPVIATRGTLGSPLANSANLFELRRRIFAAGNPGRRRAMPLQAGVRDAVESLCAAMLIADVEHEVRVSLSACPTSGLRDNDVAVALGIGEATPATIAAAVAAQGFLLHCQVLVATPLASPDLMVAGALRRMASPLEIVPIPAESQSLALDVWAGAPPASLHPNSDEHQLLVGSVRAAQLVPAPVADSATYPGFEVVASDNVRAEVRVTNDDRQGLRLGAAVDGTGQEVDVRLALPDLARHVYVPGQTGAGKSTALRAMATELANADRGFLFIDPHGDTARRLLGELPPHRADAAVFVDCADHQAPAPINPFAVTDPVQKDAALADITAMFVELFDPAQVGIIGPRWETWFRMGMLTLIAAHGTRASFLDVPRLFLDREYLQSCFAAVKEDALLEFWEAEMKGMTDYHRSEMMGYFTSKFSVFRTNTVLRSVLGTGHDVLDPVQVMDENRIVIVSLEKGLLGAPISQLLGYVYLTRFWTAALRRRREQTFGLMIDEAHTFSRGPLPNVLAEGRKFGLAAVVANQYLDQFPSQISEALLGNVGTVIAFRLGELDAETFSDRFAPEFSNPALRRAPNFVAACSLLVDGAPAPSFSLRVDHADQTRLPSPRGQRAQANRITKASRRFLKAEWQKLRTTAAREG